MISKLIFQFLAKLNKIILPSFTKKHLDLKRASKLQMLIIGYRDNCEVKRHGKVSTQDPKEKRIWVINWLILN